MQAALFPDVVVNGETVPHAVVAAEVQNHAAPRGKPGLAWRKAAAAVALRALLLQEARRRGIAAEPEEVAPGRFETPEEAAIRALLDAAIATAPPTEAEVAAEWARDPDRFRAPPLWEVSHILIACDPRDPKARAEAEGRARAAAAEACADPRGFARVAARLTDCGSRGGGGALGQISPGDVTPEFEGALRRLSAGETTAEPVLTRHGWHVIRLDAHAPGAPLPYAAVRGRIAAALEKAAWSRAARDFVATLAASARIEGADLRDGAAHGHPAPTA